MFWSLKVLRKKMGEKPVSESRSGRVDIVPQGESHFEVRFFEGEKDKRYRSWSLPLAAAEAITRWWLRRSLPLGEVPLSGESWLFLSSTM